MKKILIAACLAAIALPVFAEVNCLAGFGKTGLKVKVLDMFVSRTAQVSFFNSSASFSSADIVVDSLEKSRSIIFVNERMNFGLTVDKRFSQRSLPPTYKAELVFGDLRADMDCTID